MTLWQYLKEKIKYYDNKIAFANSGITYKDIYSFYEKNTEKNSLELCEGATKEELAVNILKCIASGKTAVPVTREYGEKNYDYVRKIVSDTNNKEIDPDLAFVMFTSGTGGKPKGVMLTHKNIISNLEYINSYFDTNGAETICIGRPLVHIAVLTGELLFALCHGKKRYFYEESFMPRRMLSYFEKNKIEIFCATPTLYAILSSENKGKKTTLKTGVISGEILQATTAIRIANSFPDVKFYSVYGLTEHSPRVSALLPCDFIRKAGSVGKPIGDVNIKIVGGELAVKSDSVMLGYYNDIERTTAKINGGWLYTGDRARFDSEGYLYIEGRNDGMLIRSGINIYPEEIENAVRKCGEVTDCVVYGEKNEKGTIIRLKYTGNIDESELRKRLVHLLNRNVIPDKIEKVTIIARTASGKKKRI